MVLNNQPIENKGYQPQTTPFKSKGLNWKWEKKHHWLLAIAVICVGLWLAAGWGKTAWIGEVNKWLPLLGGLALVGEQLVKLIS